MKNFSIERRNLCLKKWTKYWQLHSTGFDSTKKIFHSTRFDLLLKILYSIRFGNRNIQFEIELIIIMSLKNLLLPLETLDCAAYANNVRFGDETYVLRCFVFYEHYWGLGTWGELRNPIMTPTELGFSKTQMSD